MPICIVCEKEMGQPKTLKDAILVLGLALALTTLGAVVKVYIKSKLKSKFSEPHAKPEEFSHSEPM